MNFYELINKLNKCFSRIKTVVVLFLLLLFVLLLIKHGFNRVETNELTERITGLDIQNDVLKKEIKEREGQLAAYQDSINEIEKHISFQDEIIQKNFQNISLLHAENRSLKEKALITPKDEIYEYLNTHVYPDTGKKEFAFSEGQIREIHLNYIDYITCIKVVSEQDTIIKNLQLQLLNKDEHISYLENSIELYEKNVNSYIQIISNHEEIIDTKDKIIKKEKREKTILKIIAGIAIIIVVGGSV